MKSHTGQKVTYGGKPATVVRRYGWLWELLTPTGSKVCVHEQEVSA